MMMKHRTVTRAFRYRSAALALFAARLAVRSAAAAERLCVLKPILVLLVSTVVGDVVFFPSLLPRMTP
jgi:hypothetical protein